MGNIYHTVDENASFLAVFFTAFFSLLNSSRSETEAIPRNQELPCEAGPPMVNMECTKMKTKSGLTAEAQKRTLPI
jgi:hypothetical protein